MPCRELYCMSVTRKPVINIPLCALYLIYTISSTATSSRLPLHRDNFINKRHQAAGHRYIDIIFDLVDVAWCCHLW